MQARADRTVPIDPPPPDGYCELEAGIIWIRLPVPGALAHVNVWLLPAQDGWWLIDSGMCLPVVEHAWARVASALPLAGRLRGIIVTHHHPDHLGFAARLAAEHDVAVRMSARARAAAARGLRPASETGRAKIATWAVEHGVVLDPELTEFMNGDAYGGVVAGLPGDAPALEDGELLAFDSRWRVTLHEGHAPGHACLDSDSLRLLISGDQVLPSISPNISLFPANQSDDPLGQYLASLARIREFDGHVQVLPSHGLPFQDLHGRIDQLLAEHGARLDRVERLLQTPAALAAIVEELFRHRRAGPLHRLLAIGETLAHLKHLELAGRVGRRRTRRGLQWHRREPEGAELA